MSEIYSLARFCQHKIGMLIELSVVFEHNSLIRIQILGAISKTRNTGTTEHRNTEHRNSIIPEHGTPEH